MSLHQSPSSHGKHSQHQQRRPVEKAVKIFYFKVFSWKAWFTSLLWFWLTSPFDESGSPHGRQSEQQWNCWKKEEGNKNVWKKIATYELLPLCYVCILRFWQSVSPHDLKSLCHRGHPKKRNEKMHSIHIWNLLPDYKMEERRGDLLEGGRRVPIFRHTRLRLRPPRCWQWPRHNQRQWSQEGSCSAYRLILIQGQSRSSQENEAQ